MRAYLSILAMLVCAGLFAQTNISGKVVDGSNMPIPGVNIVVVGSTTGTSTDFDGKFNLTVQEGAILVVSFSGYETQKLTNKIKMLVLHNEMNCMFIMYFASIIPNQMRSVKPSRNL